MVHTLFDVRAGKRYTTAHGSETRSRQLGFVMLINYRITTILSRAPALSSAHLRAGALVPKQAVVPTRAQKGSIVRRSEQAITEIPCDLVCFVVMGWEIDAGPLHFSSNGMAVKPQLKVGYADDKVNVRAGVEDVRNGLSAAFGGQVHRTYESEGSGLNQVCAALNACGPSRVRQRLCCTSKSLRAATCLQLTSYT